jgi:hypothetical protein
LKSDQPSVLAMHPHEFGQHLQIQKFPAMPAETFKTFRTQIDLVTTKHVRNNGNCSYEVMVTDGQGLLS